MAIPTLNTSKKKLFTADYEVHASIKMLYPYIQTASGLSEWFAEDVTINFTDDAIEEIAGTAFMINAELENIGARRLHTVMSKLLNELLFDVPDKIPANSTITIDATVVKEKLSGFIKNKDLSEYIL